MIDSKNLTVELFDNNIKINNKILPLLKLNYNKVYHIKISNFSSIDEDNYFFISSHPEGNSELKTRKINKGYLTISFKKEDQENMFYYFSKKNLLRNLIVLTEEKLN